MPCFFLAAAWLITLAGSLYFSHVLLFIPLAITTICLAAIKSEPARWTWLTLLLLFFIINILVSIFFYSPVYEATGTYYILYLASGFLVTSLAKQTLLTLLFRIVLASFIALSLWALVQHFTGDFYLSISAAPNTIFTTKNTFAAALNLILLPLCLLYCFKAGSLWKYVTILLLFCGLLVSVSRGAYIAFACGFLFLSIVAYRYIDQFALKKWCALVAGLIVCVGLISFNGVALIANKVFEQHDHYQLKTIKLDRVASGSSWKDRLYYYDIALQQIKQNPVTGYGFLNYKYYFHVDKSPELYGQTRYGGFVHNDYLQLWLETGIAGFILLLSLIGLVYFGIFRHLSVTGSNNNHAITLTGVGAGLTAYFVHALVDFVMYPPVLLLLFGGYLGYLNKFMPVVEVWQRIWDRTVDSIKTGEKLVKTCMAIVMVFALSQPAVAEVYWLAGNKKLQARQYDYALNDYLTAIEFADYNVEYYYSAGRVYYTSATLSANREHAEAANRLFSSAAAINPFEYHNRYARILLHKEHPELLQDPASRSQILQWFEYILEWQPMHEFVMLEYIKTLSEYGQQERAETLLREYQKYYPELDNDVLMIEQANS